MTMAREGGGGLTVNGLKLMVKGNRSKYQLSGLVSKCGRTE
jgi:hypothetical protein